MDPLSLTASLIAVLQISGSIISSLYVYHSSAKSAGKEAARMIDEVNSLRGVLEGLLRAVDEDGTDNNDAPGAGNGNGGGATRLRTLQQLAAPGGELERCRAELEALQAQLGVEAWDLGGLKGEEMGRGKEKGKGVVTGNVAAMWKAVKHALAWPLKEGDVRRILENLQRAKSTLGLALAADQAVLTMEIREGVWNLSRDFAAMELGEDASSDYLTSFLVCFIVLCGVVFA
jgi:hypothetical protein